MNKKMLIIIIIAIVVVAGGVVVFLMMRGEPAEKPIDYGYYTPGDFFVTNVKDSGHLLKASIVLVLNTSDTKLQDELKIHNARIRDTIIFLLREMDVTAIQLVDHKDKLRRDIIEQLNNSLNIDNIIEVLFNEFVMQ